MILVLRLSVYATNLIMDLRSTIREITDSQVLPPTTIGIEMKNIKMRMWESNLNASEILE